jgi:serine/threonine protein kinase
VPGFTITGGPTASASGPTWAAVRDRDDLPLEVTILPAADADRAQVLAAQQVAVQQRITSTHLVRLHDALILADGRLALVREEAPGTSLATVLGSRGQLSPGETVTIVAPLFTALADLHAAGIVHGQLGPTNILFSHDGRPMVSDLGVAGLLTPAHPVRGTLVGRRF